MLDRVSLDQLRTFIAAVEGGSFSAAGRHLRRAQSVVSQTLAKARAKSLAGGLEPELSVAVDVMFPLARFTGAVAAFQREFPTTLLRFDVESSAVVEPPFVVSPQHPLATRRAPIPRTVMAKHVHVVHADISTLSQPGRNALQSPRAWHLSHLGIKLAFLRAGLGFGIMPLHLIEADLASGALVKITASQPR
jgi:DNA-binding transcriptional LysR family regulator